MFVRRTLLAAALVALASCASAPPSNVVVLAAQLNGAQEVPPNTRTGTGTAEVRYNRDTGDLQYSVTYGGLSGPLTGAHIHGPAAAGANAGVVVPFPNNPSPLTGTAKLTPTQAGDLMAGLYYVNLHTAAHPGGEIRGQLRIRQ
ncbi:MAG: CHRD domain-containing protein [Burkholderiales bacterium]|nr:CHRD domain-containing protein [Burkholderiales bacterium]